MQYAYEVKRDGVYYPAGADVPDGVEDNGGENRMTVAEIKAYAAEHGIDLNGATKKAEMIASIESAKKQMAGQLSGGTDEAEQTT